MDFFQRLDNEFKVYWQREQISYHCYVRNPQIVNVAKHMESFPVASQTAAVNVLLLKIY